LSDRLRCAAAALLAGFWIPLLMAASVLAGWPGKVTMVLATAELAALAGAVAVIRQARCRSRAAGWAADREARQRRLGRTSDAA
jgi:hypothetical protein